MTTAHPIIQNWKKLMECDIQKVLEYLNREYHYVPSFVTNTSDHLHFKRLILFDLKNRDYYENLRNALLETGQLEIINNLTHQVRESHSNRRHRTTVFRPAENQASLQNLPQELNNLDVSIAGSERLKVEVKLATQFYDSLEYNSTRFYATRSRIRGYVLIINNIDFLNNSRSRRNGAEVDEENLKDLFEQIGCLVFAHRNLTAQQMEAVIKDFAKFENRPSPDLCFVIIMSHGEEEYSDTIIVGTDNSSIKSSWIQECFNNENCRILHSKPKVFIYQVCRGTETDYKQPIRTETDSSSRTAYTRTYEDMLIAHSTYLGYKAHRDPDRGAWFIECICKTFMENAHNHHISDLMAMADEELKPRMSEYGGGQTSSITNIGFHKCYLHPGIYMDNGKICKFHPNK